MVPDDDENKTRREKNTDLYMGIGFIAALVITAFIIMYMARKDKTDTQSM